MDYIKYSYQNIQRFSVSFSIMMICVALATFCILSVYSIVEVQKIYRENAISQSNKNMNYNQLEIATKTVDRPVTMKTMEDTISLEGVVSGYYYEDLSYYLWQYEYLAPWLEWENNLNLDLSPILINVDQAQEYGLDKKIVHGRYFSGDPNEVIISRDLYNKFIHKDKVIQDNKGIISEEDRNNLKKGSGESIDLSKLVDQKVSFMYAIDFEELFPEFRGLHSIPLTVVGVYDPGIGYKTQGNVWLPITIKEKLTALDFSKPESIFSGKAVIRSDNLLDSTKLMANQEFANLLVKRTETPNYLERSSNLFSLAQNTFNSLSFVVSVIISVICVIGTSLLIIVRRNYDFILQRALGIARSKQILLFTVEILIVTIMGSLLGLFLTLALLQSGLLDAIGFNLFLPGSTTLLVVLLIPLIATCIAFLSLLFVSRRQISLGLTKEG